MVMPKMDAPTHVTTPAIHASNATRISTPPHDQDHHLHAGLLTSMRATSFSGDASLAPRNPPRAAPPVMHPPRSEPLMEMRTTQPQGIKRRHQVLGYEVDAASIQKPSHRSNETSKRVRKRSGKPTHTVRKDEKAELQKELRILQAQIELIQQQSGRTDGERTQRGTLQQVQLKNQEMRAISRSYRISIGGAQILLARHVNEKLPNPLSTFVHLPTNPIQRRRTILSVRESSLAAGRRFLVNRFRHLPQTVPFKSDERFVTENGDFEYARYDVQQFERVASAEQVYDALLAGKFTRGPTGNDREGKGSTAWHELDADGRMLAANHQDISCVGSGVMKKSNLVAFTEFRRAGDGGDPEGDGLLTFDSVDEDERFPSLLAGQVREDITAAISVRSFRRTHARAKKPGDTRATMGARSPDHNTNGDLVVVVNRCIFVTIRQPAFAIPPPVLEALHASVSQWGDEITQSLHHRLYGSQPTSI